MNIATMRKVDRWLGTIVCFLLTVLRKCRMRRDETTAAEPGRILFVKLAEQGATVLAHPAIGRAIEIVGRGNVFFLVFRENRFILDAMELIPEPNVICIDTDGLLTVMRSAARALRRIRREGIDTAIDFEFFARSSAALTYLSGARRRVGLHPYFGEASYRGDLMTHRVSFNPHLHTSQLFAVMVEAARLPPSCFPMMDMTAPPACAALPPLRLRDGELDEIRGLIRAQLPAGRPPGPLVLLNANCSDLLPLRSWPRQRYVELARRILAEWPDVMVAFTGAPVEAPPAEGLVRQVASDRCFSLAGKTTLRQFLLANMVAEVLVTNDSGPAHFASLTNVSVITLFGPETPALFAARTPNNKALWAGLACSPCVSGYNDRQSACPDNKCMQRITVDQVFQEVRNARRQRRPDTESP